MWISFTSGVAVRVLPVVVGLWGCGHGAALRGSEEPVMTLEAEGPEARRPHYVAAQRVLATALPIIPLWHPDAVYAVRRRWRSDPPRGDGRLDFLLSLRRAGP